jgi:hypothetical protein
MQREALPFSSPREVGSSLRIRQTCRTLNWQPPISSRMATSASRNNDSSSPVQQTDDQVSVFVLSQAHLRSV